MRSNFSLSLLVGAFSAVTLAQTITVSPLQLSFNVQPNTGISTPQSVAVTPSNATNTTLTFAVNTQTSPWLLVQGTTSGIIVDPPVQGVPLSVTINTSSLVAGQTYNGSFTVQLATTPSSLTTVNVSVVTGNGAGFSATPSSLAFTAAQGASVGSPNSQNITINSNQASTSFSLSTQTQSGGNWLSLTSSGGATGTGSGTFAVSVLPSSLSAGTYSGTITATSNPAGSSVQIPVTLTVGATAQLSVSPAVPATFIYQTGTALPAVQTLTVSSNSNAIPFSVSVNPGVAWLVVSPLNGVASAGSPSSILLSPAPSGLPAGTYNTSVVITPFNGSPLPSIPVSLVISNNPVIQASHNSLTFTSPFAGQNPVDQIVNVSASGGQVGFSATTDVPWLSAIASSATTPAQVTVRVNSSSLGVGTSTGTLILRPSNGDNYSIRIPVSVTITSPVQVIAAPSNLYFSYQTNQPSPPSQSVQILSIGQPASITVTSATSTCGSNWLTAFASQSATPTTITVNVNAVGMPVGLCSGTVSVNYAGAPAPLTIPVVVAVSAAAELRVSVQAGFGFETAPQGAAGSGILTRFLSLTSTDPNTQVGFVAYATTNSGGTWLTVGPGTGGTPGNLVVTILTGGLSAGTYVGQITISSTSLPSGLTNQAFVIPITLTITSSTVVTVSPTSLNFTQVQGGTLPAAQTLALSTTAGAAATFTASVNQITGGDWLELLPTSGAANQTLTVRVKTNSLPANATAYTAQIVLAFQNAGTAPITIPVSLSVLTPQAVLTLSPTSISFNATAGAASPASQKVTLSGPSSISYSATVTSVPNGWLSVDAASGVAPRDVTVLANSQGLAAGTYSGTISFTAFGSNTPQVVNVTLTVAAVPSPQLLTIANTASNVAGPIAAGELVTIKGTNLGPVNPSNGGLFTLNSSGSVDSRLQGVRVLFDNIPGTPIFVSATQINATVPWEIAGRLTSNVVVEYNGVPSAPITVRVDSVTPALFTLNSTGRDQVAAINQDGTVNGPRTNDTRPAVQGSVVTLYATGLGVTSPSGITGSVSPTNQLLRITGPASVLVNGQNAVIEFIGAAPGLVTGVNQINVRLPLGISGTVPILITINGFTSPAGTVLVIQ